MFRGGPQQRWIQHHQRDSVRVSGHGPFQAEGILDPISDITRHHLHGGGRQHQAVVSPIVQSEVGDEPEVLCSVSRGKQLGL